eukprot:Blabericola_migrator_1__6313@NODE_3188_length_1960_cov_5_064448_g1994_i0_p1_GENE_NODE_3188_length_1960_cov_5_064448_g1994_i0NODE_3188_length_1960_cov_5_064448_g1994_i0_p1_ORF_typecomplete_len353_score79_21_NODE_3188_length_1960_cov_5_064448_g1994_i08271885
MYAVYTLTPFNPDHLEELKAVCLGLNGKEPMAFKDPVTGTTGAVLVVASEQSEALAASNVVKNSGAQLTFVEKVAETEADGTQKEIIRQRSEKPAPSPGALIKEVLAENGLDPDEAGKATHVYDAAQEQGLDLDKPVQMKPKPKTNEEVGEEVAESLQRVNSQKQKPAQKSDQAPPPPASPMTLVQEVLQEAGQPPSLAGGAAHEFVQPQRQDSKPRKSTSKGKGDSSLTSADKPRDEKPTQKPTEDKATDAPRPTPDYPVNVGVGKPPSTAVENSRAVEAKTSFASPSTVEKGAGRVDPRRDDVHDTDYVGGKAPRNHIPEEGPFNYFTDIRYWCVVITLTFVVAAYLSRH